MPNFSNYIKELREERGLGLRELAAKAVISASLLSKVENDKRGVPKIETLNKLAQVLNINTVEILFMAGHEITPDQYMNFTPSSTALKHMTPEDIQKVEQIKEQQSLQVAINDPELKKWYLDLPLLGDGELRRLKILWELMRDKD